MHTSKSALKEQLQLFFQHQGKDISDNTLNAYAKDGVAFFRFMETVSLHSVSIEVLVTYFEELATKHAYASIARKYISLKYVLAVHDIALTSDDVTRLKTLLLRFKRKLGIRSKQAKAFRIEDFKVAIDQIDTSSKAGCRDKALLLLGFCTASRRSELCAFRRSDLSFYDGYVILTLPRSKTNPYGKREEKAIFPAEDKKYCPIIALKNWLAYISVDLASPLFFGLKSAPQKRLSGQSVNRIVKKYFGNEYSAHSLRVSFVTITKRNNAQDSEIILQTKHKDGKMIAYYTQLDNVVEHNAARKLGL